MSMTYYCQETYADVLSKIISRIWITITFGKLSVKDSVPKKIFKTIKTNSSWHFLKFNIGNNRATSQTCSKLKLLIKKLMASFWRIYSELWTDFTNCSGVSIVGFKKVIFSWVDLLNNSATRLQNFIIILIGWVENYVIGKRLSLRKKCPYFELFWSACSRIQSDSGEIRIRITPNKDTFHAV